MISQILLVKSDIKAPKYFGGKREKKDNLMLVERAIVVTKISEHFQTVQCGVFTLMLMDGTSFWKHLIAALQVQ